MGPSAIFDTTCGDTLSSSTIGPRPFSIALRFSSRTFKPIERACSDSMSEETLARSFRNDVRFVSTEVRTSSQARIERWRSSNFDLSRSSVFDTLLAISHARRECKKAGERERGTTAPHTFHNCLRSINLARSLPSVPTSHKLRQREPAKVELALNILFRNHCPFRPRCCDTPSRPGSNRVVPKYSAQHAQALRAIINRMDLPQRRAAAAAICAPEARAPEERRRRAGVASRDEGGGRGARGPLLGVVVTVVVIRAAGPAGGGLTARREGGDRPRVEARGWRICPEAVEPHGCGCQQQRCERRLIRSIVVASGVI